MSVGVEDDRESATEIRLVSRAHLIHELGVMSVELAEMAQRLVDSDWPEPLSEECPAVIPPLPAPPSERH